MTLRARRPTQEDWKTQIPCQSACPVRTDAGLYVELIAGGRYEEAYDVARAPNPFASICGRVCSAPCEDACRRGPIGLGGIAELSIPSKKSKNRYRSFASKGGGWWEVIHGKRRKGFRGAML